MPRPLFLALLGSALLLGCGASSTPLPASKALSPEKVAVIAQKIDATYSRLSPAKRQEVLQLVVRSLDEMMFIEGGTSEMGDFGWKCNYDPAEVCTWPCGVPEDSLCRISQYANAQPHEVRLDSYYLATRKTMIGRPRWIVIQRIHLGCIS